VSGEGEEVESMCTEDDAESSRAFQDAEPSYCPCFACSSDDNFCYGCTCTVCKEMEQPGESFHCLKCKECGHIAHLKCAVKTGLAGCVPDRGLDSEYWCQSCGAKVKLELHLSNAPFPEIADTPIQEVLFICLKLLLVPQ
jgi:hypothetical protein